MRLERDTRIDVFRALALLTIFITHIPGNIFDRFTLKNFGFSDAAEVFVLISGVAVGLAYARRFEGPEQLSSAIALWRRAWALVRAHLLTTVATLIVFCATALMAGRPDILLLNNIQPLVDDTVRVIVGMGMLGHQLGYNNILPMYAVLLLATPAILWCMKRDMRLTLVGSGMLWLAAGIWQIAPPNYPLPGFWFLNPLSWQFLYAIGMAAMIQVRRGGTLPQAPVLTHVAIGYLLGSFLWIHSPLWGQHTWFGLPPVIGGFDKTFLSLSRLLDVLSMAYLVARWPAVSNLARTAPDHPLAILGKHSLAVFVSGTICAMVAQAIRAVYVPSVTLDCSLIAVGIGIQFAIAYHLESKARSKSGRMPGAAAAQDVHAAGTGTLLALAAAGSVKRPSQPE